MKKVIFFIVFLFALQLNAQVGSNVYRASTPIDTISTYPIEPVLTDTLRFTVIAGQSNIACRADGTNLPIDISNPTSKLQHYQSATTVNYDYSVQYPFCDDQGISNFAYDQVMYSRLADSLGQSTIYIIKQSKGGTSFKQTADVKGDWNIATTGEHYDKLKERIRLAKRYTEKVLNKNFKIERIHFDIGETDSSVSDSLTLDTDFKAIVTDLRSIAGWQVPIIHRELRPENGAYDWARELQHVWADSTEVNGGIPKYYLISGDGFTTSDGIHLDATDNSICADRGVQVILTNNLYD